MRSQIKRRLLLAYIVSTSALIGSPSFAQQEPVKVGLLFPIKTAVGKQGQTGADLAADMLNEQGGVLGRKFQLVTYDTNHQAVDGVAAAQRLINQDKIPVLVGEATSTVALAILQVARANNALFIAAMPKHPDVTGSGYDRVFRLNTTVESDAKYLDAQIQNKIKPQKIAVLGENTDYGRWVVDGIKKKFGSQVTTAETFELTQSDFSTLMTKVKAGGADLVCIAAGKPEQAAAALRSMASLGMTAKRCLPAGVLNLQAINLAGPAADGAFGPNIYFADQKNAVNPEFVKRFMAKYNYVPGQNEALGFESVWIAGKAINAAGTATDTAKIAETLRKGTWQTPRGELKFESSGQAVASSYVDLVVKNGKLAIAE